MAIALLDYVSATLVCSYDALCNIAPWLGQWAKVTLSANWLMLAVAGYLLNHY